MSSSAVVTAPPSPVVTILRGWKERQPSRPRLPQARPRERAPSAPAASSSSATPLGHGVDERVPVERPAEQVHGEHRARALGDRVGDEREVEVHRRRVDVDEHRPRTGERDDVRRRRERVRRDDHLVAGPDPEREHREVERSRPGGDRDGVGHVAGPRELVLELATFGPIVR